MLKFIHLAEGLRFFKRSLRVRKRGFAPFQGSASQICTHIVDKCWNGEYYATSLGHFCQFWTRDFGWCVPALMRLGKKQRIHATLEYALSRFRKAGGVFTTITPKGKPFDFPNYAPDSLAMLIHSLRVSEAGRLIVKYRRFLDEQIAYFFETVIDKNTGLVRSDRHFSSIKDYAKRTSSCYDNVMVAMLSKDLDSLKLSNPFKKWDHSELLVKHFWKGTHFVDDLSGKDFITGDANVFPFWTGCIDSIEMLSKSIDRMSAVGLDKPFPLRYYHEKHKEQDMISVEIFAKNYERDTIWFHIGALFIDMVLRIDRDRAKRYLDLHKKVIEECRTYPEILNEAGKPYHSPFYYCDEGMLWASMYLDVEKRIR